MYSSTFSGITIQFEQSTYMINENDGTAQLVLTLSNASSTNITVQLKDAFDTAAGEITANFIQLINAPPPKF